MTKPNRQEENEFIEEEDGRKIGNYKITILIKIPCSSFHSYGTELPTPC